jgi:hypothetical protein
MPAKDKFHDLVVQALIDEGWTITNDPLHLMYGTQEFFVDLGLERDAIAAEKEGRRIAVEIKGFLRRSAMDDLEKALGQYRLYYNVLHELEPDRVLYLAVPKRAYEEVFIGLLGQLLIRNESIRLIVYDEEKGGIVKWTE